MTNDHQFERIEYQLLHATHNHIHSVNAVSKLHNIAVRIMDHTGMIKHWRLVAVIAASMCILTRGSSSLQHNIAIKIYDWMTLNQSNMILCDIYMYVSAKFLTG